ncbi:MAG: hypothetical protein R2827_02945 [Bdellovibrionales bacterium]
MVVLIVDMMDGRVKAIRQASIKKALKTSASFPPRRRTPLGLTQTVSEALDSAPKMGEQKTYQSEPGETDEKALRELK